jgi:hypothetical protein
MHENPNGQPIFLYHLKAQKMIADEKVTMFVDFSHLHRFVFDFTDFLTHIVKKFVRYEEDMRLGLTKFIETFKPNAGKAYY